MSVTRQTVQAVGLFLLLILSALLLDALFHWLHKPHWGRIVGYWGSALMAISFAYSARKRKWIERGRPATLLTLHEWLSWLGTVLILVHCGIHFNAWLPWLAALMLVVSAASGLVGRHLLQRARGALKNRRQALLAEGMGNDQADDALYWEALMVGAMAHWRRVHIPLVGVFLALVAAHVATALLFWRW